MADPLGVSIAFDSAPMVVTPTWTRIDNLAGANVQSWSIDRGRSSEFDKTGTGTAVVRIIDKAGLFDPTNGTSPYDGKLGPHKQAAIALRDPVLDTWHTLFRGFVEDWSYELDITRQYMTLELQLVDGFALLAGQELQVGDGDTPPAGSEGNVFYEDTAGSVDDRILAILADVGWPSGLSEIFSGNVRVREKVYSPGTSALAALQDAADAEFPGVANLYMSKTGILTFHGRQPRFRPDVAEYGINERDVGDPSATDLDDEVCPLSALAWNRGNANLYNAVLATPEGIADDDIAGQYVTDATSITAYGRRSLTFENLQTLEGIATSNTALEECLLFATYYRDNYKTPQARVNQMVFKSKMPDRRLAAPLWRMMCRAEISDLLNLTTAHPGGGGFGEAFFIEGLHYEGRPANDQVHDITLTLDVSPASFWASNPFDADPDP